MLCNVSCGSPEWYRIWNARCTRTFLNFSPQQWNRLSHKIVNFLPLGMFKWGISWVVIVGRPDELWSPFQLDFMMFALESCESEVTVLPECRKEGQNEPLKFFLNSSIPMWESWVAVDKMEISEAIGEAYDIFLLVQSGSEVGSPRQCLCVL